MSFAGHVSAMITSLKNNALPKRERLFDRRVTRSEVILEVKKKATREQLEKARLRMKTENRKRILKHIIALIIAMLILAIIIYLIFHYRLI